MSEEQFQDNSGGQNDAGLSTGLKIVSFCIPLVGLILYFTKKSNEPKAAKDAITFAAIGFGIGLVMNIISMLMQG